MPVAAKSLTKVIDTRYPFRAKSECAPDGFGVEFPARLTTSLRGALGESSDFAAVPSGRSSVKVSMQFKGPAGG